VDGVLEAVALAPCSLTPPEMQPEAIDAITINAKTINAAFSLILTSKSKIYFPLYIAYLTIC
jgi:hypothetical protein